MVTALFGIDLGGTKTEGVVMHLDGREVLRHRMATIKGSYAATLETISTLITHLEDSSGFACQRLGVGIPGSVSPVTGLVRNANSTWINGRNLTADLTQHLGLPVRISNDANCLTLSEARDGAARGANLVFGVILGTGVGGGLVVNGHVWNGAHGLAGEWGHIPMPGKAAQDSEIRRCFCGRVGCIESYLSGPAILAEYRSEGGVAVDVSGIVNHAGAGEACAISVLARHKRRLGRALGLVVNLLDPDVIVLGGGVSKLPGLLDELPSLVLPHVFAANDDAPVIDIRKALHGDSSGVRGAAWLWESN